MRRFREWTYQTVIVALLVLLALVALAGCQTVKGLAHDSSWVLKQIDENIAPPETDR